MGGPLAGRVALVTGASRGIGRGIAIELGAAGATVAVNYQTEAESAERVAESIGHGSRAWRADVADPDAAAALVRNVAAAHGGIDVAVLNAGVWRGGRIESLSMADRRTVLATSLDGAFNVARAALPQIRASGLGRIVAIGSVIGLVGFPGDTAYATAKAGLLGFVRALSKETGRAGITVNAVLPGFIETDMTAAVPAASRERMIARTSLGRPGTVEDVAAAVRFLVCEGGYITGQALIVDGGLSL
jgi:3-oxoacyl-[acyl-carrier protein] reductase